MTLNVAINGLGRIGRCLVRAIIEGNYKDINLVAVNGPASIETHVHLLKYDSIHGAFAKVSKFDDNNLLLDGKKVALYREKDPSALPWGKMNVDVVLECSGKFNNKIEASAHIKAGAKKVIISAPADGVDATIVYGVNHDILGKEHEIISVGSCTTNCLAPLAYVLDKKIGIETGFMTTIHSYTNDQNIADATHKDLRRARAAAMSMIPTSTGAAKALGLVLPKLQGKLDGVSIRVPTPNVSLVDLKFNALRNTEVAEINELFKDAALEELKNILDVTSEPLVSIDFVHNPHSAIFDSSGTKVINGKFCRVMAWYDNEWGFSNRMLDVALLMGKILKN